MKQTKHETSWNVLLELRNKNNKLQAHKASFTFVVIRDHNNEPY